MIDAFKDYDDILEKLLFDNTSYSERMEYSNELVKSIEVLHKNSLGKNYPSNYTQCILEGYKRKYNFSSSVWYSNKYLSSLILKKNVEPIKFSRQSAKGETCDYILFNADQVEASVPVTSVSVNIPSELDSKLPDEILRCISCFNQMYGKTTFAKILKGSSSFKKKDYVINSEFFGMFSNLTLSKIEKEIEILQEQGKITVKKVSFGRPILCVDEAGEGLKPQAVESIIDEPEDEMLIKVSELIDAGHNVFITGHAGTGKSFLLNGLKEKYKKLAITSTTGIAAVNIKGQTIHSWAGVGLCNRPVEQTVEKILTKRTQRRQLLECRLLAIDEISMLNLQTFEYIDSVLRMVREVDEPFGGIQVILIGDFFQLPPVETTSEQERKYCFNSPLWDEMELKNVVLTKNYRQKEDNLITALSHMRTNCLTNEDLRLLKSREYYEIPDELEVLRIFSTNYEADNYNNYKFRQVDSQEVILTAIDGVKKGKNFVTNPTSASDEAILNRINQVCRAEKNILLKVGARVMLLINLDFDKGLINGSCGYVKEIFEKTILVEFDNGVVEQITRHEFEFYKNDEVIARREQFPLRLAYGITIHKSQGMSLDKLVVDCSRIFEKGQMYVALSRIKTLNGLYLYNFDPQKVMVDERVASFYKELEVCNN